MKLKGKINNISFNLNGGAILYLDIFDKHNLLAEYEPLLEEELLDIEVKKHRAKRSLNANNYMWSLINEMANVLRTSKEDVYLVMLKRYGQSEIISVLSNINISGYFKYYDIAGTSKLNGKEFTHYKVYKGSSEYDTREMSVLIDGVVSECKDLGIETMTPDELAALKNAWSPTKQGG